MGSAIARQRAATAAVVAALFVLAGHAFGIFARPEPDPGATRAPVDPAAWMQIPTALMLVVMAGIPLLGAVLLLSGRTRRRLVGLGVVGAFALATAATLPSQLLFLRWAAGSTYALGTQLLRLAFVVSAITALWFVAVAVRGDGSVRWTDPRRTERAAWRLVLLAAVALGVVASLAPQVSIGGETTPWLGGAMSGGLDLRALADQVAHLLLPAVGVLAVGVAAAGARPAPVGAAAGGVIAAHGVVAAVGTPLSNNMMETLWGHGPYALTPWYWLHVAAVGGLVVACLLLARGEAAPRRRAAGRHRSRAAA